jgi:nucleotide-binding universal stress UspA family protein
MVKLEKILCPMDFSDFSRDALDHAVALAKWYGASVTVMHVLPIPTVPVRVAGVLVDAAPLSPVVNSEETANELNRWAQVSIGSSGVKADVLVTSGLATMEIARQVELLNADLLVLGTHGRSGFQRLFLGSVTEKLLRTTTIPVMTIPPPVRKPESVRYKTILCPVDFSDESMRALDYALSLAKEADARIILLHVVEGFVDTPYANEFRNVSVLEYYEQMEADAAKRLVAAVPDDARTWARPVERVIKGRAYRQILKMAQDERAELIVMGVRGRGAIDRLIFGSTTHHVIRGAECPVLTLHSDTR